MPIGFVVLSNLILSKQSAPVTCSRTRRGVGGRERERERERERDKKKKKKKKW